MEQYFSLLVHEFNHSFINHLVDKYRELFEQSGKKMFETVGTMMRNQAYGQWEIMIKESLVRAAVIKYMKDHDFSSTDIANETLAQLSRGFFWTEDLVTELERYAQQRASFATLESYMPQMAKAFEQYAQNIEQYKASFDAKRPKIVSIAEFSNNDQNVDPGTKTITVNFDRPLLGKGYSIGFGQKGTAAYPKIDSINYSSDNTAVIIKVQLEPRREYEMVFMGLAFKSTQGIPMENYTVGFSTF